MSNNHDLYSTPDPHRPVYHFLPLNHWMNDPNGLIHWKGQYHMFYQYNPHGSFHGTIHWGHAVSRDLVHWEHLPIALTPTPGGPDKDGCWSGCAVNNSGIPTFLYTGVYPQVQCIATGSDDLLIWQKHRDPIISAPPPEIAAHAGGEIRDPFVWKEQDRWYMLLGSRIEGVGGLILLYCSDDLFHWEYLHPFLTGDANQTEPLGTGTMWECPNFLDFGEKRTLIISVQEHPAKPIYAAYFTGRYEGKKLIPETQDILVHGNYFYAPQVMRADDGRYIMWGWIQEGRTPNQSLASGWSGVMSLPIQVSPLDDGKLRLEPVNELKVLRQEQFHFDNLHITPEVDIPFHIEGHALEIEIQFPPELQTKTGLILRASLDGQDQTRILYDPIARQLVIHRLNPAAEVDIGNQSAPLSLAPGEALNLRIFLDHSVLEIFANQRTCLVSRIYPSQEFSHHVGLFAQNNPALIPRLDVWRLKSIWE